MHARPLLVVALLAAGCVPDDGGDGEAFDSTETGDGDGDGLGLAEQPEPVAPLCIEADPGQVSCWAELGSVWAMVWLECQLDGAESAGVLGPSTASALPGWGDVACRDYLFADGSVCFWGPSNVMLGDLGDVWGPSLRADVDMFDPVDPPC